MMNTYKTIILEQKENLGYLTLNRPDVHNAISQEMTDEIADALIHIDKSTEIKILIVTGAGKSFQAGADIAELNTMNPLRVLRWNEGVVQNNATLEKLRQPVIAAINGAAMGGGMELAMSCTLRIVAASAKMGLPEVKLGIIPGAGGTQRLPRLIGKGRAAELLLTGDIITAEEAYRIGLANKIAPVGETVTYAEELAARILVNAPIAVELTKDALEIGKDLPLDQAVQYAQKNCVTCFSTEDMKEGTAAFMEKRKAQFKGI